MSPSGALIQTIRSEVEDAAQAMISAATRGLRLVGEAREGRAEALEALEETFCAILEACAFQDITGQRLSRLEAQAPLADAGRATIDPLLNGPADPGAGLSQDAADALFADTPRPR